MTSLEYRGLSKQELKKRNRISMMIIAVLTVAGGALGWNFQLAQDAANEERSRSDIIVNSAPIAMIMCGADRKITVFNPAAETMFGYTREEMMGQTVDRLLDPAFREDHDVTFEDAIGKLEATKGNWLWNGRVKGTAVDHDGETFDVIVSVRGIKYGDTVEFIAAIKKDEPAEAQPALVPLPPNIEQRAQALKR